MSVKKGITGLQIEQLIRFTGADKLVAKFTHDQKRFKNILVFRKWQKGKVIYTLDDKDGNLLGLIWFGKKKNPLVPDCPFTFAIRVYSPARGKGHALKFMKDAFADFKPNGVWLSTRHNNLTAIGLYEKFGFKKIAQVRKELIMAL